MKTKWIQPHDPALELETLTEELRYLKQRYRHVGPSSKAIIAQMIKEVKRDIRRNIKKMEAHNQ